MYLFKYQTKVCTAIIDFFVSFNVLDGHIINSLYPKYKIICKNKFFLSNVKNLSFFTWPMLLDIKDCWPASICCWLMLLCCWLINNCCCNRWLVSCCGVAVFRLKSLLSQLCCCWPTAGPELRSPVKKLHYIQSSKWIFCQCVGRKCVWRYVRLTPNH